MSTKTLKVTTSDEVRIKPYGYGNKVTVIVDDPEIEDMLMEIKDDDIIRHVRSNGFAPDEVFEDKDLHEWAISKGYSKQ